MPFVFNPFTGNFDVVNAASGGGASSPDNFSYLAASGVTVPAGQQMIYDGHLEVFTHIQVDGQTTETVDYSDWSYSWYRIPAGKALRVPRNRSMIYSESLQVEGVLTVDGRLIEVV